MRSGISRLEFSRTLSQLFAHFYVLENHTFVKRPVSEIGAMFNIYGGPRDMCLTALVSDPQ